MRNRDKASNRQYGANRMVNLMADFYRQLWTLRDKDRYIINAPTGKFMYAGRVRDLHLVLRDPLQKPLIKKGGKP